LLSGCRNDQRITWSAEAKSPDGEWIATAISQQWSGPGNAYDATSVSLKRTDTSDKPTEILELSHQYATLNLKMEWQDSKHFDIWYGPSSRPADKVDVDFQVVKMAGIDISLKPIETTPTESLR
jgi:hypothetical protein